MRLPGRFDDRLDRAIDALVGGGRVDRGLLRADPEAPYGHRLDQRFLGYR